jgi:hypothetical protein
MRAKLTSPMMGAIALAKLHGGFLKRYPGGYWGNGKIASNGVPLLWFGTGTIQALVSRGYAAYTDLRTNKNGSYHAGVKLKEADHDRS